MGEGSVMTWNGFRYNQRADIVIISGRINSKGYLVLIGNQFKKNIFKHSPITFFSSNNANIQIKRIEGKIKRFFKKESIQVMGCPLDLQFFFPSIDYLGY